MQPQKSPTRRSPDFFSAANLDGLPPENQGPGDGAAEAVCREQDRPALISAGRLFAQHVKASAFGFQDCPLHVGVLEFAPGLPAPLHSHSDDCIYYVERGSFVMGNRIIGPGEGFLTRRNQPYSFVVGPEGARIIEFTQGPRTDITIHERNVSQWQEKVEKAVASLAEEAAGSNGN